MRITLEHIAEWLPATPHIVEAGAHKGVDTIKMAQRWPQAQIYAFEPAPALYEQLVKRTKPYTNIQTFPCALGEHTGTSSFFVSAGASSAASSVHEPQECLITRPDITYTRIEVPMTTLDSWAQHHHLSRIDFLWLDMQGGEFNALKSSPNILANAQAMLIEVNLTQRFAHHPLYPEFKSWLEKQGFLIILEDLFAQTWGNILCLRKHH